MTQDTPSGPSAGDTGLIITVPEAQPAVGRWRSQYDNSAAAGVPPHITVLYPFLHRDLVDASVVSELAALVAEHPAFDVELPECRRFPDALYLALVPDAGLRALTAAVGARWPEAPPYGGNVADPVPHLTIAQGQDPAVFDQIEQDVTARLPIAARVAWVRLISYDGSRWLAEYSFGLAPA